MANIDYDSDWSTDALLAKFDNDEKQVKHVVDLFHARCNEEMDSENQVEWLPLSGRNGLVRFVPWADHRELTRWRDDAIAEVLHSQGGRIMAHYIRVYSGTGHCDIITHAGDEPPEDTEKHYFYALGFDSIPAAVQYAEDLSGLEVMPSGGIPQVAWEYMCSLESTMSHIDLTDAERQTVRNASKDIGFIICRYTQ